MTQESLFPDRQSQSEAILAWLLDGYSLTPIEALDRFKCMRLGGRIYDLKKAGHPIADEWVTTRSGKRVKSYFIPADNQRLEGNSQKGEK